VNIIWSEWAIGDLKSIYDFIALDSEFYADRQIDRIINSAGHLAVFPNSGRVVPEFNNDTLRELIEGNYRIVYSILNEQVEIVRIHHSAKIIQ
jgi:plasmid stabilization system protein ParE